MLKSKKLFVSAVAFIFSAFLWNVHAAVTRVNVNFPSVMISTRKFQNDVRNRIVELTGIEPTFYAITALEEDSSNWVSDFFECINLEESNYVRPNVFVSAPYFVAQMPDQKKGIAFSFAFSDSELEKCMLISEVINNLNFDGTIDKLADHYKVYSALKYPVKKASADSQWFIIGRICCILVLAILLVVFFIFRYAYRIKNLKKSHVHEIDEAITRQLKNEVVQKYEEKVIEPSTGLFTSSYVKDQIKKEMTQFDVFGRNFSVATFTTKEFSDPETIKKIAEIIKENLNAGVVTSYKGNGVFLSLFSNKDSEEIGIFVDLVVEKIYQANISVSSDIFDFKGQMTFLGRLGLDDRNGKER